MTAHTEERSRRRIGAMLVLAVVAIVLAGEPTGRAAQPRAAARSTAAAVTRTYFIAADEVDWNYAPADTDHMTGRPYDERARVYVEQAADRIGRVYQKAVYREYTDASFTQRKPRPAAWEHLGILGPIVRAEVGDTIKIVFRNNARFPFSVHAHGVRYEQASDGTKGVATGETFTYTWTVTPSAGPQPGEPSSKFWLYHSHANEQRDVAAGLVGGIIISARGTTRPDGTPKDVDREFVTIFYTLDENQSQYLDLNIARFIKEPQQLRRNLAVVRDINGQPVNVGFPATNFRETMNGYLFGNVPGLEMKEGERVRWYSAGMAGNHTAHWHANTVRLDGVPVDVVPVNAAEMHTTDMLADNPGTWMFHCHVEGHLAIGMYAHYLVTPAQAVTHTHTSSR